MTLQIACPYCGASHTSAAAVRECWRAHGGAEHNAPGELTSAPRTPLGRMAEGAFGRAPSSSAREPSPARRLGASDVASMAPVLGRSVLVRSGQVAPLGRERAERVRADVSALEVLEDAWRSRRSVVVEVEEEPDEDEVETGPVWSLDPGFAFPGERLAHAMFTNSLDVRSGPPRWPLVDVAVALGARPGGRADVLLPDGTPAYLDGG